MGLVLISDLFFESPFPKTIFIYSSGFSPFQYRFARSVLIIYKVLYTRIQISRIDTRKKFLLDRKGIRNVGKKIG
jgi:hypothetical protein